MAKKDVVVNEEVKNETVGATEDMENNQAEVLEEVESTENIKNEAGEVVMKDFGERRSSIKKTKMPMTIRQIKKEQKNIRFDLAEQRNLVWKEEQKSLFIHTLIYGYPFPTAFAVSTNDGNIWMLDGKQRTSTVLAFIDNEFKLHKNTPDCFGEEIAGKYFKELPEDFQDEIMDTSFDIWEMKNMTNAERAEMFFRLNNGSALSKLEVTRSMYNEFFSEVSEIASLPFFADIISVTNSARNRFVDQELVVQIAMMLDDDYKIKGFGGNHIRDYVLNLKEHEAHFPEEMVNLFSTMSTYLEEAFDLYTKKEVAKALKKINVPMVFMQGIEAKNIGMTPQQFGEFVKWFLIDNYKTESAYGQSCQAGSAKRENVLIRLNELKKAFGRFVKKHPIESYQPAQLEVATTEENKEETDIKAEMEEVAKEVDKTVAEAQKEEVTDEKAKPKSGKATGKATGKTTGKSKPTNKKNDKKDKATV